MTAKDKYVNLNIVALKRQQLKQYLIYTRRIKKSPLNIMNTALSSVYQRWEVFFISPSRAISTKKK